MKSKCHTHTALPQRTRHEPFTRTPISCSSHKSEHCYMRYCCMRKSFCFVSWLLHLEINAAIHSSHSNVQFSEAFAFLQSARCTDTMFLPATRPIMVPPSFFAHFDSLQIQSTTTRNAKTRIKILSKGYTRTNADAVHNVWR